MPFTKPQVLASWKRAVAIRELRATRFDEAMRLAMPGRSTFFSEYTDDQVDDVFDETAVIGVQEFASRLQSGITPNFTRWAILKAGAAISEADRDQVNADLRAVSEFAFEVIEQSNFSQESYEAYLDLAVTLGAVEVEKGTALEPLRFNAIPIAELYVENGPFDRLDRFFRLRRYTADQFEVKYPGHDFPADKLEKWKASGKEMTFLDAVMRDWEDPNDEVHCRYICCKELNFDIVFETKYRGAGSCPVIAFRWSKEAGAVWGRGPLLNALPAIKTLNLVLRMILENAQMSIAGVYNMDDDGTVNVDTIQLVPGTIIPRAPGSKGLEPVMAAGDFRVADIVIRDQRDNIKRALYNDMLGSPDKTPMSATEVAERMADLARQIGAAFGRLMGEFVMPLLQRVVYILKDLGLVKLPVVDGREVKVVATSPLSQAQDHADITNVDRLAGFVAQHFGPQMLNVFLKGEEIVPYLGDKLNVPDRLIRKPQELKSLVEQVSQLGSQVPGMAEMTGAPAGQMQLPAGV